MTRREQAGSLTLPPPPSVEVTECGGNVLLMEARLCELTSSIRALLRSNTDLVEALGDNQDDPDFLQAIEENKLAIRRQGRVAVSLAQELQTRGANIELEEDIQKAVHFGLTTEIPTAPAVAIVDASASTAAMTSNNEIVSGGNQANLTALSNNDNTEITASPINGGADSGGIFL